MSATRKDLQDKVVTVMENVPANSISRDINVIVVTTNILGFHLVKVRRHDCIYDKKVKILGYRDPRCKHKYLDSVEWLKLRKVYELIERSPAGP